MNIPIWGFVLSLVACIIVGIVIGFFVARAIIAKQIKENPPITAAQIKAMYASMGRTASQAQINATMKAMEQAGPKNNKKKKRK